MNSEPLRIVKTTLEDFPDVRKLFGMTKTHQGKAGYKVWEEVDYSDVLKEIADSNQFKILYYPADGFSSCLFSIYQLCVLWKRHISDQPILL